MKPGSIMGWRVAIAVAATVLVAACSGGESLPGVGYRVPGESTNSKLLPLTVPPDFGLRPEPADETAEGYDIVSTQSEEVIIDQDDSLTQGEEVMLVRSDAVDANPDIRRMLDQDNAVFVGNPEFVDDLLFGTHPAGGEVTVEEGAEGTQDVVIREGSGDDESDWDFLTNWF
jgi:Protein of unknown function (DUF3035)